MHRVYSGPVGVWTRRLWHLARHGRRGSHWRPVEGAVGTLAWGHSGAQRVAALLLSAGFAGGAWLLGGWRFDPGLWPLWSMAAVFAGMVLLGLVFSERFVLDPLERRWRYQRGWLGRVREESGAYEDLSGLVLEELWAGPLNGNRYVLVLEFADGLRFCDLSGAHFSLDDARGEARHVATLAGLPLTERSHPFRSAGKLGHEAQSRPIA